MGVLWLAMAGGCDDGGNAAPPAADAALADGQVRDARIEDAGDQRPDAAPDATPDAAVGDAAPPDAALDAAAPGCTPGETRPGAACGLNGRGAAPERCVEGRFVAQACVDPDECVDDATAPCPDTPGEARCVAGRWDRAACVADGVCPPAVELALDTPWAGVLPAVGTQTGTCGGDGGEQTARFVAPAAGRYAFDTAGSAFDTVLYLRAACADPGSERGCNDDASGLQSRVELDLAAGEAVVVVVDGFDGGGAFTLSVQAVEPPDCADGARETRRCEAAGAIPAEERRTCVAGAWTDWSPCVEIGVCVPGAAETTPCRVDDGPGESTRTCDAAGQWSPWSDCEPAGGCFAGVIQWEACEVEGTQRTRTCGVDGAWGEWSGCLGAACPPESEVALGTSRGVIPPGQSLAAHDCGDGQGNQHALTFTPPEDGQYAFWLQAPNPMLALRGVCGDGMSSLVCDTYTRVAFEFRPVHAKAQVELVGGAPVTLFVGSERPDNRLAYTLNVAWRDPDRCVDEAVDNHDWARALPAEQVEAAFGGSLGLVSTDQCAGQPDWFAIDVPMRCNLTFTPLRELYGRAAVGLRRPDGVRVGDSGLLGPFSRIIGTNRPGTYRMVVDPAMGAEPQTLVSVGLLCGDLAGNFHCGRGDDAVANDDPDAPAALVAGSARSEPICGDDDVDYYAWTQGAACHSRLTIACPMATFADIELAVTGDDGTPIPAAQIRPEPGLGPIHGGWVVDRPAGSDHTRVRLSSADPAANGRCDLLVEEFCLDDLECNGVGSIVGDHGAHAFALCERPIRLPAASVPAGCALEARQIAGPPVTLTIEDAAGMQQAEGEDAVRWAPAATTAATVLVAGNPGDQVLIDAAVRCP